MKLRSVIATIECSECGGAFTINLEPAWDLEEGKCVYDLVIEAIRGSMFVSMDKEKALCKVCTIIADGKEKKDG